MTLNEQTTKVLITGITGQDGYFLTELLLSKGYEVHGLVRRVSNSSNLRQLTPFLNKITLHEGNLESFDVISRIISNEKFDMVFNLAAQSHVAASTKNPMETLEVNANGCIRLLESIRLWSPQTKFYNSCSAEIFDTSYMCPQDETCKFKASSPYSISKISNYYTVKHYREAYNLFACQALLYNHESHLRPDTFVTRKITKELCKITLGKSDKLVLGDLNTKRDWGYAPDFVNAIYRIITHSVPDDFVIGTGKSHSIYNIIEIAAKHLELDMDFLLKHNIVSNPSFNRPIDQQEYLANISKAQKTLNWSPTITFEEMITQMTALDYLTEKACPALE